MTHVDLAFAVRGQTIPHDHGYALYSALAKQVPSLHRTGWLGVHAITGRTLGRESLVLHTNSRMTVRIPADRIATLLPLAGKTLDLHGSKITVGVPTVHPLIPAASLDARVVFIKLTKVPEKADGTIDSAALRKGFEQEARRQLDALEISQPFTVAGRQSLEVHGKRVVGFSMRIGGLSAEQSLRLQIEGIGGKRAMGAGLFRPTRGQGAV